MKVLVALGGNALGDNPTEQLKLVENAAHSIADLVENGHQVVVVHGNGPQVGMIQSAFEFGHTATPKIPTMPLPEAGAMSQGYIGYHLSQVIKNVLNLRKLNSNVVCIVTQTIVSAQDSAFKNPSKPIGRYFTKEEAKVLSKKTGLKYLDDSGRGYRLTVPSPIPIDIVEKDAIKLLLDAGYVVIAGGGGGIPVEDNNKLNGLLAVIDKDYTSAKLAELIQADAFIILTAIKRVSINFRKPNELEFSKLPLSEAKYYIEQSEFGKGSMEPKIIAAVSYLESHKGGLAIIASLEDAAKAITGEAGTLIYNDMD